MIFSALVLVGLFSLLRQMERWLHQHIFKVGWLVTKNFQTTTVLYYTFFLPGVVLHEAVYWLAAGVFNVRAERAIAFPEKQEIGELKLNFIRLSKKASPLKVAAISAVPPLVGLLVVWWIATNIFRVPDVATTLGSGQSDALGAALRQLLTVADFWLWLYLTFTVANTMMPNPAALQGWRPVLSLFGVVVAVLVVAGLADDVGGAVQGPLLETINSLSSLFGVIIAVNAVATALLSLIENTIERVTGDSATFKNGKLVAMRRAEILEQRRQEREKAEKARKQPQKKPVAALPAGPPSIYRMPLPVPAFGTVPISQLADTILEPEQPALLPEFGRRDVPTVIPGEARPGEPPSSLPRAAPPSPPATMPLFNPSRAGRDEDAEAEIEAGTTDEAEEAPQAALEADEMPDDAGAEDADVDDALDDAEAAGDEADDGDEDDEDVEDADEVTYEDLDDDYPDIDEDDEVDDAGEEGEDDAEPD